MKLRNFLLFSIVFIFSFSNILAAETGYFHLASEPVIRIGLATNARSVSITTTDSSLVAVSPDEPQKFLSTNKISVSARSYRPPVFEIYYFEIPNIATRPEADDVAKDAREATGEKTFVLLDAKTNVWRVRIGDKKETIEEANEFKAVLGEKGFGTVEIITEKFTQLSEEAVKLSGEIAKNSKSEVRSIISTSTSNSDPNNVRPIVSSNSTNAAINPNLREVIVNGASDTAKFSSLKSVAFGSINERAIPVRFNGKAYRGKIEVFVNSRGSLTVVNAVSLEDYLLGVVPNELSLPAIEAQKAQAVAARTYAIANIGQFGKQGFDLLPTIRSQVYKGHSSESKMGTQAVLETRGVVATYKGKPITAYYTSTCGGRTENSENIFDVNEPYLRGVECSLEGHKYFEPFLIKTVRLSAKMRDEKNLELVRLMSLLAVNGFQLSTVQLNDDFFEDPPTDSELSNWLNQLAIRFAKPFPNINKESAKPLELARILSAMIYGDNYANTLLSEADINYQLTFDDASEIPQPRRADVAILFRDAFFSLYPDLTLKPNKAFSRAKMLRLIKQIYTKKKWFPSLQSGVAKSSENGKLVLRVGKTEKQLIVRPDVFLLRKFGDDFYQVKETALVGGETVNFQTNGLSEVVYLEIEPTTVTATAERMSSFTLWNTNLSPSTVQSRLSRYVRGIGSLIDVRIARQGFSRRAIDLEIVGTNGIFHLKGGKIRSALRLNEQLFVINKRYDSTGRATSYSFTGRGWGHGVGMCQYGAYGLAKMGVKYDAILKHYYTGIDLTKAY
ncbi:MAG: SpoIID/LytB domain-containing protein [Acidobacteria bacterium]|nr:SpoIID/LytB domain-containing protein [Acidobacteriota bacterium]MCA1639506.1 SpoIID/LytB domain-containing protein [Acidobacteriota bacterium]